MRIFKQLAAAFILLVLMAGFPGQAVAQNWFWAKSGGNNDQCTVINSTADISGNVYIIGYFFEGVLKYGSYTLTNNNASYADMFLVKYNRSGTVEWAVQSGGDGNPQTMSLATDRHGNVYITGTYTGGDISFGTHTLTLDGFQTIFMVKYNSAGTIVWAESYGGPEDDGPFYNAGNSITVDEYGYIYACGTIESNTLTIGSVSVSNLYGAYLAKFDSLGSCVWAVSPPGDGVGTNVTADHAGNVYMTGFFGDSIVLDSITYRGPDTLSDLFIAKYDSGGHVLWGTMAGTRLFTALDEVYGINFATAVDKDDNVFVSGSFQAPSITFGSTTLTDVWADSGGTDPFLVKYDSTGHELWAKSGVGKHYNYGLSVATDNWGNAYYLGSFGTAIINGAEPDTGSIAFGSYNLSSGGVDYATMFIVGYDPDGNIMCATAVPELGGNSISSDPAGDIYVAGNYGIDSLRLNDSILLLYEGASFAAKFACGDTPAAVTPITGVLALKLYPNPTAGYCHLQFTGDAGLYTARVYDITGREVMNLFTGEHIFNYEFDTQNLLPGLYLVELSDEQGHTAVSRFVKE